MKPSDSSLFSAAVVAVVQALLVTASAAAATTAAMANAPPPPGVCTDELVAFSPCLPYVSSSPNNVSSTASSQCCDAFTAAFAIDEGSCLCYLVRQPSLLGFPLNVTGLLSLPSFCNSPTTNATSPPSNAALESRCSGLPPLPPLQSTTSSGLSGVTGPSKPPTSAESLAPSTNLTPANTAESPVRLPSLPPKPARPSSSAARGINNCCGGILLGLVVFYAPIFSYF